MEQEPVDMPRDRHQAPVPQSDLACGGHGALQQKAISERSQKTGSIEIPVEHKLQPGRVECLQRAPRVSTKVADGFIERGVEPRVGRGKNDQVAAGSEHSRRSFQLCAIVLQVFEDIHVQNGIEPFFRSYRLDRTVHRPAHGRQSTAFDFRLETTEKLGVRLQTGPAADVALAKEPSGSALSGPNLEHRAPKPWSDAGTYIGFPVHGRRE